MRKEKPSRRRWSGFTLVEVMIAMGILAMALPMIASTLMAGMIAKKEAVEKTMATIVAENAISILRVRASNQALTAAWGAGKGATLLQVPNSIISTADKAYKPCGEASLYGYEVLGQRMADNANDFRFAVLVYRKVSDADTVSSATASFDASDLIVVPPTAGCYKVTLSSGSDSAAIYCYVARMSLRE